MRTTIMALLCLCLWLVISHADVCNAQVAVGNLSTQQSTFKLVATTDTNWIPNSSTSASSLHRKAEPSLAQVSNRVLGVVIDHTNTFVNLSLFTILCLALWAIIASTTILLAYKLSRWIWVTFVVNAIKQKHEKDKTDYLVKVNQILVSKNYYGHDACPALYELIDFLFEERDRTLRKIPWFKWSGFFLLLGIPIVSTLLSVLIGTGPNKAMSTFIEPLSVGLTLATVISATIKPAEHFRRLCKLGVHIDKLRSELLLELEGLQHLPVPMLEPKREKHHGHCRGSVDENEVEINRQLCVLIHAKRRALMNISLALIDDFLPEGKTPDQDTQNKSVGEKIDPTLTWKHVR